ncbi:putative ATPase [Archangium gephyra]|uniref:ABC transport protein, ATP-binding subunit n=1 Tax=Archangium gephyra TaxID=48 RepID=A0AAC8Q152_9BACT|nr:AAA family ATPase [Archangium gephyra]AKI99032.1 ABC transport protein, ATP-binding subunit [Archangium gephyra]REG30942.1 putative ATPase [Archangium gephyra]
MLERIEIENLGSIQNTGVSLSPLTVLLGSNASGKTTVMRGIELFAMLRNQPWQEVTYAGKSLAGDHWPNLINGGDTTKRLILRGFVQPDSIEPDCVMKLGIDWKQLLSSIVAQASTEKPAEPEFLDEKLKDPKGGWLMAGTQPNVISTAREFPPITLVRPRHSSITRVTSQLGALPPFREQLADLVQNLESFGTARYFRPNSAAMLYLTFKQQVSPDGSGFVAALATLQNRESERFEGIEQRLSELFPHIRRIRFDISAEGKIQHLVFETRRSARLIPAEMEADGVLTTLFLLWAGATTPPHGTLLIDDPEVALHPHLMGKRVEFLRSLANGELTGHPLRVVVATQSIDFVRWVEPSEIRVVEYSNETGTLVHAIPENETLRTLVDKFQANAGDLWYSGTLGGVPGVGE